MTCQPSAHGVLALACRWAALGSFSAYDEGKLWAWAAFGSTVLGLPPSIETGQPLRKHRGLFSEPQYSTTRALPWHRGMPAIETARGARFRRLEGNSATTLMMRLKTP